MNAAIDTTTTARRGWWRRNLGWLIGALLLGAFAMIAPYRDALREYAKREPLFPTDVPAGQWADYAGARWRLLGLDALPPEAGPFSRERPDAALLVARFEVIAAPGTVAKTLNRCQGRLSDAQGRLWQANQASVPRKTYPQSRDCGSDDRGDKSWAAPGKPFRFVHIYQVPRAQAARLRELHPEIVMPATDEKNPKAPEPGRYLRFAF